MELPSTIARVRVQPTSYIIETAPEIANRKSKTKDAVREAAGSPFVIAPCSSRIFRGAGAQTDGEAATGPASPFWTRNVHTAQRLRLKTPVETTVCATPARESRKRAPDSTPTTAP